MYQIEVAAVKLDDSQLVTLKLKSGNFICWKQMKFQIKFPTQHWSPE